MSNYWEKRFLDLEHRRDELDQAYIKELETRYRTVINEIEDEIQDWMQKYAVNDQITTAEAEKLLSGQEQMEWRISLSEYRQKAIAGGYDRQLNRLYYRSRITRLEKLKNQVIFILAEQANLEVPELERYLMETYNRSHLGHIYEISDLGTVEVPFSALDESQLLQAVYSPWAGAYFSQRVWGHHLNTIPNRLAKTLAVGSSQGWSIDRMVNSMMADVDVGLKNRMVTLVQTESAKLAEDAAQLAFEEAGVEELMWLATLEINTCKQCADLDGQTWPIKEAPVPNEDTHPNCRCTRVPTLEGAPITSRWHRDPITGKGKIGKEVLSFDDFYKKYSKLA